MTIREALVKLGYDFNKLYENYGSSLPLDTDILEHGLLVSEKLCTPGNGRWMVMVECQRYDDWGYSRPWHCLIFEKDAALLNPSEWGYEHKWLKPGEIDGIA